MLSTGPGRVLGLRAARMAEGERLTAALVTTEPPRRAAAQWRDGRLTSLLAPHRP
jgi:hypothetical protein